MSEDRIVSERKPLLTARQVGVAAAFGGIALALVLGRAFGCVFAFTFRLDFEAAFAFALGLAFAFAICAGASTAVATGVTDALA